MPRTPLRMPKMSMTMEQGELGEWQVGVGDQVELGQVVCDVLTDKVDMEVESTAAGTVLELAAEPGDTVAVGAPIAWIDAADSGLLDDLLDGSSAEQDSGGAASGTSADAGGGAPSEDSRKIEDDEGSADSDGIDGRAGIRPALPRARRLAAERGVDLQAVTGTGPGGAVLVGDVERHRPAASIPETVPQPEPAPAPEPAPEPALHLRRAAALAARAGDVPAAGPMAWRDVVLGPAGAEPPPERIWAALAVATARALAAEGPPAVSARPRIGLAVPTAAGPVTLVLTAADRLAGPDAERLVATALDQARAGLVDVAFLGRPDAVVGWLPDVDRAALPPPAGALLAVAAGAVAPRAVATGAGLGVRTVVSLGATASLEPGDPAWLARTLSRIATEVGELLRTRSS